MCVFSRTFGNAAPGGCVGVRMLVMLNHGGEEMESGMLADPDHEGNETLLRYVGVRGTSRTGWIKYACAIITITDGEDRNAPG